MLKNLFSWFVTKPYQTSFKGEIPKPVLRVFSTTVPQSFLEKFKDWDGHLYPNQTIIKD